MIRLLPGLLFLFLVSTQAKGQDDVILLHRQLYGHALPAYQAYTNASLVAIRLRDEYCTTELLQKQVMATFQFGEDYLLCDWSHYGWSQYGEMVLKLGYARRFGKRFALSMRGIYLLQHATNYPSQHSITLDLSAACVITDRCGLAFNIYNPVHLHYGITGYEVIPIRIQFEAYYHAHEHVLGFIALDKSIPGGLDFAVGIDYHPMSRLLFHGCCSLQKCGFGFSLPLKNCLIHLQADWYYKISFSPEGAAYYLF